MIFISCNDDELKSGTNSNLPILHNYDSDHDGYSKLDDAIKKSENQDRNNWQKPRKVIDRLGALKNKVVADIGAGSGYFLKFIHEKYKRCTKHHPKVVYSESECCFHFLIGMNVIISV